MSALLTIVLMIIFAIILIICRFLFHSSFLGWVCVILLAVVLLFVFKLWPLLLIVGIVKYIKSR